MTPKEALDLLDKIIGNVAMSRLEHLKVIEAVNVLRTNINVSEHAVSASRSS